VGAAASMAACQEPKWRLTALEDGCSALACLQSPESGGWPFSAVQSRRAATMSSPSQRRRTGVRPAARRPAFQDPNRRATALESGLVGSAVLQSDWRGGRPWRRASRRSAATTSSADAGWWRGLWPAASTAARHEPKRRRTSGPEGQRGHSSSHFLARSGPGVPRRRGWRLADLGRPVVAYMVSSIIYA
jgi:hypothetical protein